MPPPPPAAFSPAAPLRPPLRSRRPRALPAATAPPPAPPPAPHWRPLALPPAALSLRHTLPTGQAFRWRRVGLRPHPADPAAPAEEWAGVIADVLFVLRQRVHPPSRVWYRPVPDTPRAHRLLADYTRAADDFAAPFRALCARDPPFRAAFAACPGARTLRQHPVECLFAFICSANNNLPRIARMVRHLAAAYGTPVAAHERVVYHAFPPAAALAAADPARLRAAGFGYRADYVVATARELVRLADDAATTPDRLLLSYRALPRDAVADRLLRFPGVGRKVAGCVALMSLDQLGEVPVDTHVWRLARAHMPHLRTKTLTDRVYREVGDSFRRRFGDDFAGVAHTVLFAREVGDAAAARDRGSDGNDANNDSTKNDDVQPEAPVRARPQQRRLRGVYKKTKPVRTRAVKHPLPKDFQPPPVPPAAVEPDEHAT